MGTANFIATVKTAITANNRPIDTSHWLIKARSLNEAKQITDGQIANVNRTIPSVTNTLANVESFKSEICSYLARNINCQGHKDLPLLKQERGGNER